MALIDDVKKILNRLGPKGWKSLFQKYGLNVEADDLKEMLLDIPLNIPRDGIFKDFHPESDRAIVPGIPAQSFLYHAFASPIVVDDTISEYPSLNDLDVIENYIYSLRSDRTDLSDCVIAVFAYQYRVGGRAIHQRFADFSFSRTGIARVGTSESNYVNSRRSFWVLPKEDNGISVMPARYGVFFARKGIAGIDGSVLGPISPNDRTEYFFPVHKIFLGDECLDGQNITKIEYKEYHINEKLRKTHEISIEDGGLQIPDGFDISKRPYVLDSTNGPSLVTINPLGSSVLIEPVPTEKLISTVEQNGRIVGFKVPEFRIFGGFSTNRLSSSLMIPPVGLKRLAPEYVNIRQEANPGLDANQNLTDINLLTGDEFDKKIAKGGYFVPHFVDGTCDGCVEAIIEGVENFGDSFPAFSLVTAPDFIPLADQFEVREVLNIPKLRPLSDERLPGNPKIKKPSNNSASFSRRDTSLTAVVGDFATGEIIPILGQINQMVSFLPDAASGVFQPGWDVSRSSDGAGPFFTTFGLGSPFPEDAKLCAAIQSFWPAVAPDNGRTFGNEEKSGLASLENQFPMLDDELGFHPKHIRVDSGEVESYRGWDGEYGPFYENETYVNYVAIEKSDYIRHSLDNRIRLDLTANIQSEDLVNRAIAMLIANRRLKSEGIEPTEVSLVSFRNIINWSIINDSPEKFSETGFLFDFAKLDEFREETQDLTRVRRRVIKTFQCIISGRQVGFREGNEGSFRLIRI